MAKKAVYEPGELDKVKKRLGDIDAQEAKRMQKLLGGEIGEERSISSSVGNGRTGNDKNAAGKGAGSGSAKPKRLIEIAPQPEENGEASRGLQRFRRQGQISYTERVKMDICCGNKEYGIKTPWQVFVSRLSFFKPPPDRVSPWFVKNTLNDYYMKLENLVTATRLVFPRNNSDLGRKIMTASKTAYKILNTLRQWKLDVIVSEISKVQSRPRNVFVRDFETMLRKIYGPLYVMERLDAEKDVKWAFSILYDIAVKENFRETKMLQNKIAEAVYSYRYVAEDIHRLMYPLLMKTISLYYQDYELFFYENSENYKAFLGLSEADQIEPDAQTDNTQSDDMEEDQYKDYEAPEVDSLSNVEDGETPQNPEEKAAVSELKALNRSMKMLETLFPKAPWDKFGSFPDFYPYFADVLELKKNAELIAPEDPAQLALILSQVIEELLYGFRYIRFEGALNAEDALGSIVEKWHNAILEGFEKNYIPRIAEYAHYFEHSGQNRTSTYAGNLATDIHWIRRYYFFPHYSFLPPTAPSFLKKDVVALYPLAHTLRKNLTVCASLIEAANRAGGAVSGIDIPGIENPWDAYNFEVANPLSKRLDMLLGKTQRNNMSLIFFTLAVATVFDNYLCDKNSVAYKADNEILFRHAEQEKMKPVFWVEKQNNTFEIFKKSVYELKKKKNP